MSGANRLDVDIPGASCYAACLFRLPPLHFVDLLFRFAFLVDPLEEGVPGAVGLAVKTKAVALSGRRGNELNVFGRNFACCRALVAFALAKFAVLEFEPTRFSIG